MIEVDLAAKRHIQIARIQKPLLHAFLRERNCKPKGVGIHAQLIAPCVGIDDFGDTAIPNIWA